MKHRFLSQKGRGRGRGVKEKDLNGNKRNTTSGIGLSTESDDTMNEDTPVGVASTVKEGVIPSMIDKTATKEKISSLEDTTVLGYFSSLSTPGTTTAGNTPGKSSYANLTGKPSGKKLNFCTLFTPGGNGIDVVVYVESIRAINERFANTTYGFFLGSIYARAMIELRADVDLKDNIVVVMPKLTGEGHYICNVRIKYEWKPPRCASCKVFGHIHEECPKNTSVGEKKTLKKPSQTSRGVPVGPKMGFKPQKEYRPILKKPTASSSGNKKKGVVPTLEVSNSNPFEVLNSVDNDVELGINGEGATNLVNNEATSSGSSFINVNNSSTRTTPIIDKIGKFEESLTSGKATLVDEAGNLLKKVKYPDNYDSEMRDSYGNGDYDEDPYDDDMYEGSSFAHVTGGDGQKHSGLSACMLGPASEDLDHAALAMFASGSK
ncbi:RNA-directed DNA polymerase, eukaryota, reverse transcriptase zinc-binding domain protein [Tanacetum coccineum]